MLQKLNDGSRKVKLRYKYVKKLYSRPSALDRLVGIYVEEKNEKNTKELIIKK